MCLTNLSHLCLTVNHKLIKAAQNKHVKALFDEFSILRVMESRLTILARTAP